MGKDMRLISSADYGFNYIREFTNKDVMIECNGFVCSEYNRDYVEYTLYTVNRGVNVIATLLLGIAQTGRKYNIDIITETIYNADGTATVLHFVGKDVCICDFAGYRQKNEGMYPNLLKQASRKRTRKIND